jgi:hypothetical protein
MVTCSSTLGVMAVAISVISLKSFTFSMETRSLRRDGSAAARLRKGNASAEMWECNLWLYVKDSE